MARTKHKDNNMHTALHLYKHAYTPSYLTIFCPTKKQSCCVVMTEECILISSQTNPFNESKKKKKSRLILRTFSILMRVQKNHLK